MFGFGNDKKKEAEAQAKQEEIAQAMRQMSDQIAAKGAEIAELQRQLEAAKHDATQSDAATKALAEAQARTRQLEADLARLQAETGHAAATSGKTMGDTGGTAGKVGFEMGDTAKSSSGASGLGTGLGGMLGNSHTAGGLTVGGTAWVQKAGGQSLRLRDRPGLQSNAFAGLAPGTQMTLLEGPVQDDGYPWWRIRAADGREGWVAGTELVTSPD